LDNNLTTLLSSVSKFSSSLIVNLIFDHHHRDFEGFNANNTEIRAGSDYAHSYVDGDTYKLAWTGVTDCAVYGNLVMGIGLAKTKDEIRFNSKIKLAKLLLQGQEMPPPGTQSCEVVGYEYAYQKSEMESYHKVRLRHKAAPIYDDEICGSRWYWYRNPPHICAGKFDSDIRLEENPMGRSETGGALVCNGTVVALDTGPTKKGDPGFYIQIVAYRKEIDSFVLNQKRTHG
jgi:Trypsin